MPLLMWSRDSFPEQPPVGFRMPLEHPFRRVVGGEHADRPLLDVVQFSVDQPTLA